MKYYRGEVSRIRNFLTSKVPFSQADRGEQIPLLLPMTREDWLEKRIAELEAENAKLRERLAQAKDPEPVQKPSKQRVIRLARNACMDVEKSESGWVLSLGRLKRWFRRLKDIWELLTRQEWELSEIFPPKIPQPCRPRPRLRDRNPSLVPPARVNDRWVDGKVPFS